ncbi:Sorting and assembly machinery component 50 B [Echinococcus granulosus]|uniref:Sorting and assembly machinery component 50 B n=1 Tax=Echinococcus granulosus TaxID=6210 RepID=W6U240_ECHGR|nr:Sorting and assembly machinery component 50 B [Echinococcus granulosus]EUB55118.1 Sorting and assembly machinery component 50 B [Echinococcus granulosus]
MDCDETFVAEDIPVYVTAVSFFGLGKTNVDFLKKQLYPLVKSKNMRELLENSSDLKSLLLGLQIFKFCEISIDTEKQVARPDAYKPFERNPNIKLSFGGSDCTYDHWWSKILRNESSIFAELGAFSRWGIQKLHWSNIWREIEASSPTTPFNLRLESGVSLKTNLRHSLEVDSRDDRIFPQSGILLRLSEELAFLNPPPPRVAVGLETAAPSDMKKSVQLRLEGVLQKPLRLTDWLVAEATFSAGLVHSLSGHPVSVVDRFFLGGPMELRGYKFYSVGPGEPQLLPPALNHGSMEESGLASESHSCPTGALASCFAGLHLYTPLPFINSSTAASFARLHAFTLTGCLLADPIREWRLACASGDQYFSICQATAASVVGAGLVLRFAGALRLEINYCVPLAGSLLFRGAVCPTHLPKPGFQMGFGENCQMSWASKVLTLALPYIHHRASITTTQSMHDHTGVFNNDISVVGRLPKSEGSESSSSSTPLVFVFPRLSCFVFMMGEIWITAWQEVKSVGLSFRLYGIFANSSTDSVTPKPVDSVRMLVVDGKEREVGQVIILLTELPWPPAPPPSLVTSQLHVRELQPTKHNPIPCGQLSFWIWVLDYWPEGTIPMAASGSTHSKHGTPRGSLSFKAQQHDFTMTPPTGDSHSRLGAKLRNMKNRVQGRGDNGSYVSSATRQSRLTEEQQPQAEEGSVIMGASIISSHPGLGPMGWATGASDLTGGILDGGGGGSESNLLSNGVAGRGIGAGTKSYNPLASQDEEDSGRMERKLGRTPSLFAGEASTTPTLNGRTGDGQNPVSTHGEVVVVVSEWGFDELGNFVARLEVTAAESISSSPQVMLPKKMQIPNASRQGKSRRKVMVEHLRNKISRSSANISELGHKIRSRRSSPDGSRCEQECKGEKRRLSFCFLFFF